MIDAARPKQSPPSDVRLVISDVDGSLVTSNKRLTKESLAAVQELRRRGVFFTIASSRPPFGLHSLVDALEIDQPFAAFNGGMLLRRSGEPLATHWLAPSLAEATIRFFEEWGLDVWVFTAGEWMCRSPDAAYVDHERRTVSKEPVIVQSFSPVLHALGKIVAVSEDAKRLAQCEVAAQERFGSHAGVARSQTYYLDVTHLKANKAEALKTVALAQGVALSDCVAIGDGANDGAMLEIAGYGIAMGNGSSALRSQADFVTSSNEEEGFARAIAHILGTVQ